MDPTTPPHREKKHFLIQFFLPTGSPHGFPLCCWVHSQWDHWVSALLPCLTHIIAGAVEIISTVHCDVNGMHLSPAICCAGFGEVTWRWRWHKKVTATQTVDFSFTCSPSSIWSNASCTAVRHTVTLSVTSCARLLGHLQRNCKALNSTNCCMTLSSWCELLLTCALCVPAQRHLAVTDIDILILPLSLIQLQVKINMLLLRNCIHDI